MVCSAATMSLTLLGSCTETERMGSRESTLLGETIRITEEPWRSQEESDRSFKDITEELTRRTKRRFEYIPSLSYSHAKYMVSAGEVDLAISGSYGAYLTQKSQPNIEIIAVEKASASSALITNRSGTNANIIKASATNLGQIRGLRIGFGSRYAGLAYSYPMLQMAKQNIHTNDLYTCTHIADQELLRENVIAGRLDYAFIRLSTEKARREVSGDGKLKVAWLSPSQQDFIVIGANRLLSHRNSRLRKNLTNLLISLSSSSQESDRKILDALGIKGLESPSRDYPAGAFMELRRGESVTLANAPKKCH